MSRVTSRLGICSSRMSSPLYKRSWTITGTFRIRIRSTCTACRWERLWMSSSKWSPKSVAVIWISSAWFGSVLFFINYRYLFKSLHLWMAKRRRLICSWSRALDTILWLALDSGQMWSTTLFRLAWGKRLIRRFINNINLNVLFFLNRFKEPNIGLLRIDLLTS